MRFGTVLGLRRLRSGTALVRLAIVLGACGAAFGIWTVTTRATGTTTIGTNPSSRNYVWYNRTPFPADIVVSNGANVGAYQFTLQWDPNVLQWVSGTFPTAWLQTNGRIAICQQLTAPSTPTPTGTIPTSTPTDTPAVPTNTPTITPTPVATTTPSGYLQYGCGSLGNFLLGPGMPPGPDGTGTIASIKLKSIATAKTQAQLTFSGAAVTDTLATPAASLATQNGMVRLVNCYDMDGDGLTTILDLATVAKHYGSTPAAPIPPAWIWNSVYDVDHDAHITILDLAAIATSFGLSCIP